MASKTNGVDSGWARAPPSGTNWEKFWRSIYDTNEKTFLGRTAKRWGIVFVFYAIFYALLAVMFAACMTGLFYTIDDKKPTWTLERSLIGNNPGVTFRPSDNDLLELRYRTDNFTQYRPWLNLKEFLDLYENETWFSETREVCNEKTNYGFPYSPCFFIKVNKIFDWKPEFYDDPNSLPEDMPEDLKDHIRGLPPVQRTKVWISCADEHGNSTKIEYPSSRGLPSNFFPFRSELSYVSPVVAVKLTPEVNTPAVIRCRAWAKNIIYNKSIKDASGYARISVYVETKEEATTEKA